ncbi:MAG: hypothetical protein ACYSTS_17845 [Planctomycetota bacterium]|jgi:hypothetical protein
MEKKKLEAANKLLSAIEELEDFKYGTHDDLLRLFNKSGVKKYNNVTFELDSSVYIKKVLGDVGIVKYESYHFTLNHIENKIKELEEQIDLL